jgi:hypothetical protein
VRPLQTAGIGLYLPSRMFNASLGVLDDSGRTVGDHLNSP